MQPAEEALDDGARDELEVPDPGQDGRIEELDAGEGVAATLNASSAGLGTRDWGLGRDGDWR